MENAQDPILNGDNSRFVIFPIDPKYQDLWELYKIHESAFWKAEEIDYGSDLKEWETLSEQEQHFIEMILAFFAGSDGIVLENIMSNFVCEVQISEAKAFYAFQGMIENVHALTYALLLDTFVRDPVKKRRLFNAIDEIPVVTKKAAWAQKWMNPTFLSFGTRLVAFAVVEGIFFSGAFCSIFWLKDNNKMIRALGHSNELIARDEGLHVKFAVSLFHHLKVKPNVDDINVIIKDAVILEKEFICHSIPCDMIGMNSKLMSEYIEFVADRLLTQLGYPRIYNTANPFHFMDKIGLDGKTNFFEKRVTEYQLASKESINFNENNNF